MPLNLVDDAGILAPAPAGPLATPAPKKLGLKDDMGVLNQPPPAAIPAPGKISPAAAEARREAVEGPAPELEDAPVANAVMAGALNPGALASFGLSTGERGAAAAAKSAATWGVQQALQDRITDAIPGLDQHPYIKEGLGAVGGALAYEAGTRPFSAAMAARRAANTLPKRIPVEPLPTEPEPPAAPAESNGGTVAPQSGESAPEAPTPATASPAGAVPPPTQPEGLANTARSKSVAENTALPPTKRSIEIAPDNGELQPHAKVFDAPVDRLNLDPERFQHKLHTHAETGESYVKGQNLDVQKWDESAATPLTVWRDNEGKYWVVNGHQRYAAAKRLGVDTVPVQVLDEGDKFPGAIQHNVTAERARSYGAELNIKQNQGTAMDFAKYIRDSGKGLDEIRAGGVPISRGKAEDAIALSKLSPSLFRDVALERFPESKAVEIGKEFSDNQPAQDAIYRNYRELEEKGEPFTDKKFAEWVKHEKGSGAVASGQKTLFGETEEESLSPQMAEVSSYARDQIADDKRVFGSAKKKAAKLETGGTVVDKEQAGAIADSAKMRQQLLDQYAYASGTATNAATRKWARVLANTPKNGRKSVLGDAYQEIYDALQEDHQRTFTNAPELAGVRPEGGSGQGNLLTPTRDPAAPAAPTMSGPNQTPEPTMAERESAGQGSMLGGYSRGQVVLPQGYVQAGQAVVDNFKTYKRQIQRAFAPTSLSDEASGAGALISRRNAEMENDFTLAVDTLDRARGYMDKLDRPTTVDFIDRMERGRTQADPALQATSDMLRNVLDRQREAVRRLGTGALQHFYENYFPHIWTDPQKAQELYTSLRGSLEGSKSFLKHRTFDYFADGYNAGLTPVTWNPVELTMLKYYEMGKYIRGQKIFQDLKDQGWAKYVKLGGAPPPGWAKINDKIARVYQYSDVEKGLIHRGDWYAPEDVSLLIDRHLSPGLKRAQGEGGTGIYGLIRGVNNSMNQFQLGVSAFHVATTTMNSMSSHMALAIQKGVRGDLRGAVREAAISMSGPGSLIRDMLQGRKMYRQFYGKQDYGPEFQQAVTNYIQSGANFDQARPFIDNWAQSWSRAWREGKVFKGVALTPHAAVETLARPIFEYVVPRAKAAAFMDLAKGELGKLPSTAREVDRLRVLSAVQNSIDNRFGMLNYDKLFWDNKMKDLAFIGVRAVGWNVGDVREFGGGLMDLPKVLTRREMTPRAAYAIAMPLTAAVYGSIYQYAKTGHFPGFAHDQNGKFDTRQSIINFLAPKTGGTLPDGRPERVWLPGYQKDLFGTATKPTQTVSHKLSPLVSLGYDIYSNEDYFHRQVRDPEASLMTQAGQVGKFALGTGAEPLTVQNLLHRSENQKSGGAIGVESAFGFTPASRDVTNSPMMNYMDDALKERSPQGAIDQKQFEHQQTMRDLENKIRGGKKPDLGAMIRSGELTPDDVKRAILTATHPYLEARFSELPFDKALKAYQLGDADERRRVAPLIFSKLRRGALAKVPASARQSVIQQLRQIQAEQQRSAATGG